MVTLSTDACRDGCYHKQVQIDTNHACDHDEYSLYGTTKHHLTILKSVTIRMCLLEVLVATTVQIILHLLESIRSAVVGYPMFEFLLN